MSDKDDFDAEFARINQEHAEAKRQIDATAKQLDEEIAEFDRRWEAERAAWQAEEADWEELDHAMAGIARDFFAAIRGGSRVDLDNLTVRTAAQFERFLDWHEESSKLWQNGYISDDLQAEISRQFGAEAMGSWRLDLMEDPATPDEVHALQERMAEVCEHATFVAGHIERTAADALPQPSAVKPVLG